MKQTVRRSARILTYCRSRSKDYCALGSGVLVWRVMTEPFYEIRETDRGTWKAVVRETGEDATEELDSKSEVINALKRANPDFSESQVLGETKLRK